MSRLTASEQWLELLNEPAALIAQRKGTIVAANSRFAQCLKVELASLPGAELACLVSRDDAPRLQQLIADGTDPPQANLRFLIGGGAKPVALTCQLGPARLGHRLLRLAPRRPAVTRPAKKLERDVKELRQKLTWFREAIDKVGHSVVIFDQKGRLVLYNKFYRDGYRSGDRTLPADVALEGKTYRELMELRVRYKLHKEFADEPEKFVEDRVRRFEQGSDHVTSLANGRIVRAQYRRLADGIRVYISTDITELVETEQKQLATELAYRTKSQFLANMSHELRTPLNAILGFSELIRDARMGPLDSRYRGYADDVFTAGQHLLHLINDILDLSKIEVGRMELHDEVVDIANLVNECCRLVRERANESRQKLELAIPPDTPCIKGDELRLKQVLLNLLSNAVKFTPPGGTIRITATPVADGGLILSVADTGIGMKLQDISKALTPFEQIDGGLSRGHGGTGLGLPLAKTLTELHGATFEISSQVGVGTTVTITLPPERVLRVEPLERGASA